MELIAKLQIKPGQRIATVGDASGTPRISAADNPAAKSPEAADAVIAFVRTRAEIDQAGTAAVAAGRADKLAWIAYPKAGKLGTDLNRDTLREALESRGVQPVRQVALDETWTALRLRPA
ncbi:MAG TPA: hypothetical protein VJT31_36480 [Rugosimonospora sp.]|nr:hypothetical protein [Rugosimonospora sp.]